MTTEYNGWKNYETWAVKLWMDNEEPSYRYWQRATAEAWESATDGGYADPSHQARLILEERLKREHEDTIGELDLQGFAADLLNGALSDVDFFEIADALLSDADTDGYSARVADTSSQAATASESAPGPTNGVLA